MSPLDSQARAETVGSQSRKLQLVATAVKDKPSGAAGTAGPCPCMLD
jgi:hypothetical protein